MQTTLAAADPGEILVCQADAHVVWAGALLAQSPMSAAEAEAHLLLALSLLEQGGHVLRSALYGIDLARARSVQGNFAGAMAALDVAIPQLAALGLARPLAQAQNALERLRSGEAIPLS